MEKSDILKEKYFECTNWTMIRKLKVGTEYLKKKK